MFLNDCLIYMGHDHLVSFDSHYSLESFVLCFLKFRLFFCGCRDVVQKYPSPVGSTNIGYDYSISLESRYFYTISCQIFHFFLS